MAVELASLEEVGGLLEYLTPVERAELRRLIEDDLQRRPLMPQPGMQQAFATTTADIAIAGGSAGPGKTWSLLYSPLEHLRTVPGFNATLFRRTTTQLRNPGGAWDEAVRMYPRMGGHGLSQAMEWHWRNGGKIKMAHLEHENTVFDWHSAQVAALLFDELTQFSRSQFFYMLSRNRSTCGVAPYVRAACNPDPDSWVAEFVKWWIDQDTGFPIPERAGVLRYFARDGDALVWGDTRAELVKAMGPDCEPLSVTFIPGKIQDNPELLRRDPGYLSKLKALPRVDRMRLLDGNWKVRAKAGMYFQRGWCEVLDAAPADLELVRYWDLAATPKTEENDPDWTVGWKMGRDRRSGKYVVTHVARFRDRPRGVRAAMRNTAEADGREVRIGIPQDPGQAGKAQVEDMVAHLVGFSAVSERETGDKVSRFGPVSSQCEAGNIAFVRGPWLETVLDELEGFPDARFKDCADAFAGALRMLSSDRGPDYRVLGKW